MNSIGSAFNGRKALITYLMAGDPDLESSAQNILTAQEAGANLIEIGIPFSDPIAEGPVIQAASLRALAAGTRLQSVFEMVESLKGELRVPVAFMTYLNPVFSFGYERFFARCAESGVAGVIIPDLPAEEQGEVKPYAKETGTAIISLVAPTSEERTASIASNAEGFLYLVSSLGVTGLRSEFSANLGDVVKDVRARTKVPTAIGFGVSTPEQASYCASLADGVIVGSSLVRIVGAEGRNAKGALAEAIGSLAAAVAQTGAC